ncbi:5-oxoprolinase subunit B family protein [Microlunatus ginsengisoli]|uniref:Allophanate hydrolase subunit 1 n=1 Tax=Microlunatus ginsengisoli TaxID=363863 RepID=A0ABP7AWL9_9ACTN
MSGPVLRSCGERAVLVELADLGQVMAASRWIRAAVGNAEPGFARVVDVVPAARTVLVGLADRCGADDLDRLRRALVAVDLAADADRTTDDGDPIEIPVHYDGDDLAEIAARTGLDESEVIAAHTGTPWQVAFCGFAPGFAYLVGGDERLRVPRRDSPRTAVPAGSVALAGEFSAVYPRSSPGGWQLLGRTELEVWDTRRDPAALLAPGARVRFVDASPG